MSGSIILKISTEILNLLVFEGAREPTTYVRIFADKLYNEALLSQPSSSTQKAAYLEPATFQSFTTKLQDLIVKVGGGGRVEGNTMRPIANIDVAAKEYVTRAIAANYKVDEPKVMDALAAYVMMVCAEGFKDNEVQAIMSGSIGNHGAYVSPHPCSGSLDTGTYH